MVSKSVVVAAVLAISVGQAEAAVVSEGEYQVKFTLTENYQYCPRDCDRAPKPPLKPFHGLNVGDVVEGYFFFQRFEYEIFFIMGLPNSTISRDLGDGFYGGPNWYGSFHFDEAIEFDTVDGRLMGSFASLFVPDLWEQHVVLDFKEIAPVPLPATVALLPLGIGALAVMRRRRRLLD